MEDVKNKIVTLEDLENALRKEGIDGVRKKNYFYGYFFPINYEFKDNSGALTLIFYPNDKIFPYHPSGYQEKVKDAGRLMKVSGKDSDLKIGAWAYTSVPFPFNRNGDKKYSAKMNEILRDTLCEGNKLEIRDGGSIAPKSAYITRGFDAIHGETINPRDLIDAVKEVREAYFFLEKLKEKLPEKLGELIRKESSSLQKS